MWNPSNSQFWAAVLKLGFGVIQEIDGKEKTISRKWLIVAFPLAAPFWFGRKIGL